MTHGGDRLVWGAALKYSLWGGLLFVTEQLASLRSLHRVATLGMLKLDSANSLQHGLAWVDTNQLHAMSGDG